jgi:YegS/Rv2252/BmrU family lipid kinase
LDRTFASPCFIVNPQSARARFARHLEAVRLEALRRFPVATWVTTSSRGDATVRACAAAQQGADLVVAVSGDGTINEVVNGLMESAGAREARPALGILPAGSGSDFIRTLRIPRDLRGALEVLSAGCVQSIDVGRIDCAPLDTTARDRVCRYFVNIAGCASSARVVERFNRGRIHGTPGYVVAAALTAVDYRFPVVDIVDDGGPASRVRPNVLFVCNGEYCGGGMHVGKGARVDDGLLQVVEVSNVSRIGSLLQWPRLYTGSVDRVRGARVRSARVLEVTSDEDVLVDCDGDLCGRLPARYTVVAQALNVCVPRHPPHSP